MARVAAATVIGGPADGAAALIIEAGRATIALAGEEGAKAGKIVGATTDVGSAIDYLDD